MIILHMIIHNVCPEKPVENMYISNRKVLFIPKGLEPEKLFVCHKNGIEYFGFSGTLLKYKIDNFRMLFFCRLCFALLSNLIFRKCVCTGRANKHPWQRNSALSENCVYFNNATKMNWLERETFYQPFQSHWRFESIVLLNKSWYINHQKIVP